MAWLLSRTGPTSPGSPGVGQLVIRPCFRDEALLEVILGSGPGGVQRVPAGSVAPGELAQLSGECSHVLVQAVCQNGCTDNGERRDLAVVAASLVRRHIADDHSERACGSTRRPAIRLAPRHVCFGPGAG